MPYSTSIPAITSSRELDLSRTHVGSPIDGVIANLSLLPGSTVAPGVPQARPSVGFAVA